MLITQNQYPIKRTPSTSILNFHDNAEVTANKDNIRAGKVLTLLRKDQISKRTTHTLVKAVYKNSK